MTVSQPIVLHGQATDSYKTLGFKVEFLSKLSAMDATYVLLWNNTLNAGQGVNRSASYLGGKTLEQLLMHTCTYLLCVGSTFPSKAQIYRLRTRLSSELGSASGGIYHYFLSDELLRSCSIAGYTVSFFSALQHLPFCN